jgi:hypothetical protein
VPQLAIFGCKHCRDYPTFESFNDSRHTFRVGTLSSAGLSSGRDPEETAVEPFIVTDLSSQLGLGVVLQKLLCPARAFLSVAKSVSAGTRFNPGLRYRPGIKPEKRKDTSSRDPIFLVDKGVGPFVCLAELIADPARLAACSRASRWTDLQSK